MRTVQSQLDEAQALLNAAWNTADRRRFNKLLEWSRGVLTPLAAEGVGEAMWMLASIPVAKGAHQSQETFEREHRLQAEVAAEAGSASAMFFLGCELDAEPTLWESSKYFERAANLGHAYSQWCFGLNLLSGRGTEQRAELGLEMIRQAADKKFEGAIQFLSHAYAQGTYGLSKDQELAAQWWSKLKDKDVIHY